MPARILQKRAVVKPWGQRFPQGFSDFASGEPIGEIWHEPPSEHAELLVKHLFTEERLSIQVHPHDAAAQARGLPHGKDEAWLVTAAKPGAQIGLGLTRLVDKRELREALLAGTLDALVDWRPVRPADFIYAPGGTIHAIGDGISLIEIQQNLDLTYRLFDYGRPRELHIEEGLAVASPGPVNWSQAPKEMTAGRTLLASGGPFVVERWSITGSARIRSGGSTITVINMEGAGRLGNDEFCSGTVACVSGEIHIVANTKMIVLVSYLGSQVITDLYSAD